MAGCKQTAGSIKLLTNGGKPWLLKGTIVRERGRLPQPGDNYFIGLGRRSESASHFRLKFRRRTVPQSDRILMPALVA